ncbi:DUF1796 family putative cysteine peptidase [Paenibacillus hamazuiensis]|uniref:DUF1796 family putative cysteine peptidase n=1 Tax=Paenibacillus hamazuiensis TaxID=2936508 RepID=UPI00200EE6BC|nr:DUF1796 family putative cysteine peptidase [Paenibacillus hamazuiensis]
MNFQQLAGTYDIIFSLGHNCLPATQLSRYMIRKIGGVIDWMESPQLSSVNYLLHNRFANFMELPHLTVDGINNDAGCYIVRDTMYNILSHHDFPVESNQPWSLNSYPELREKVNRRVPRFLETLQQAGRILFIRTEATPEETAELLGVLRGLVKNEFNVLVVNHAAVPGIIETPWPFENVCALQIPWVPDMFRQNNFWWDVLMSQLKVS